MVGFVHAATYSVVVSCNEGITHSQYTLFLLNYEFCAEIILGSRIMGGGFGGCTVNLVKDELYEPFIATVKEKFKARYGHEPKIYPVVVSDGARIYENQ